MKSQRQVKEDDPAFEIAEKEILKSRENQVIEDEDQSMMRWLK